MHSMLFNLGIIYGLICVAFFLSILRPYRF